MIGKPSEPHLSSHVVERQGVGERLAGGLDGEVVLVVADGESGKVEEGEQLLTCTRPNLGNLPLSIGCAETHPPLVGISTSKLGDVVRRSSLAVASTPGSFKIQLLRDCLIPDHKESLGQGHWANIESNWFCYSTLAIRYHIWNAIRCDRRGSL